MCVCSEVNNVTSPVERVGQQGLQFAQGTHVLALGKSSEILLGELSCVFGLSFCFIPQTVDISVYVISSFVK
jgi:hypothetical protein